MFLEKLSLIFFLQSLEFLNLKLGAVRVLSSVANLNFNFHFSNPCTFRDMSFLMIFSKPFKTLSLQKINLKISDLKLETVRVFSGLADLASEYDGSIICRSRDMMVSSFFPNIFRKLGF